MSSSNRVGDTSRGEFDFECRPETDQSFKNALAKARDGTRLTVADAVELLTTGTDHEGIDTRRKEQVLRLLTAVGPRSLAMKSHSLPTSTIT